MVIHQYVEAVDAEAVVSHRGDIVDRLLDVLVGRNECLYDYISEFFLHVFIIDALFPVGSLEHVEVTFGLFKLSAFSAISTIMFTVILVTFAACQVHAKVILCQWVGGILLGGEAYKALLVYVDLEWSVACDKYIESEVIFKSVNKMRILNVLAHNVARFFLMLRDRCSIIYDAD